MWYYKMVLEFMKKRHRTTLELIFARPVNGSIRWADIKALFVSLGAEVSEREGSRICVVLFVLYAVFQSINNQPQAVAGRRRRGGGPVVVPSDYGGWGGSWSGGGGGGGWSGGGGGFGGGGSSGSW